MNKGCPQYSVDLSAYFDGELEGEERRRVEAHLQECDGCRQSLAKLSRIREAMSQLAGGGPRHGRSVLEALKDKLQEEKRPGKRGGLPS